MISLIRKLVLMMWVLAAGSVAENALAGPIISVAPMVVEVDSILPGGSHTQAVTVTNSGDSPLTVSEIGYTVMGCGGPDWLFVSADQLYVLPGPENSVQFNITFDATQYFVDTLLFGEVFLLSDASNIDSLVVLVGTEIRADAYTVEWDVLGTNDVFGLLRYCPSNLPGTPCLGLSVSDHGAIGLPRWTLTHMDHTLSGLECGSRETDGRYLVSGSPFVLINDDGEYSLAVSNYQEGLPKPHHWRPQEEGDYLQWGSVSGYGSYVWLRTPALVSADGKIGLERTYFAPRTPEGYTEFIRMLTRVYSADGLPHSHVTIGSVIDWDIPSDIPGLNSTNTGEVQHTGFGSSQYVYAQGTDTIGSSDCQYHSTRFGAECMYAASKWTEWLSGYDPYWRNLDNPFWGAFAGPADLMRDTSLARDGSPLSPPQPDPKAWWEEIAAQEGFHAETQPGNQAVWNVYMHDIELGAEDTLAFVSALTSVRSGTPFTLKQHFSTALVFEDMKFSSCCLCCVGSVGDANGSGSDTPTIGDVTALISLLFMEGFTSIPCMDEADINQSGGCCSQPGDVTIGDIIMLIDYLFVTGPENMDLPPCYW